MIEVEYDGAYPNACSGCLTITVDGEEIYSKRNCCTSTGCTWFDDSWNGYVESGKLLWDDADQFDSNIQAVVQAKLQTISVCCGGCL